MADFLIHQNPDGTPIGVFSATSHYYPPNYSQFEAYGVAVMKTRGTVKPWRDWIEDLASSFPTPHGRWSVVEDDSRILQDVYTNTRDTAETVEG